MHGLVCLRVNVIQFRTKFITLLLFLVSLLDSQHLGGDRSHDTSSQLYDALFAELKRWIKAMPQLLQDQLEVKQDRIEVKDAATEAFISARTSRAEQPEALQGVHSDNVMLVEYGLKVSNEAAHGIVADLTTA